ncbi:MAG: carnitine dehydratase [Betaproteobacteria bacterium RIFCSPLOWO2_12_FULL_62_58]|nr:MAG: carnitine dehydratase [Betaproteobacteria bacterium RIFCSPLOWO2_02_FULL_62_79]OGA46160.1 MAG: carnitine dehydratase [Betaproteobacteria bacterium RIFCSPLOWO2_12_FULL_62_58]
MDGGRPLPLQGYRVLDLATMIAAPFCAGILGEFGAEVIKVEMPGKGDPLRSFGTMTAAGSSFNWLNEGRNKKSITLDIRRPEGAELAKKLAAQCDVVAENFRPGTLERWGLGYDILKSVKSDLILVRVSAYGQDGPYRDRPGYARIAHGFAGLTHLAGEPEGPPVVPGSTALADYISGVYAAVGALLALIARDRFGIGQSVDIGLYEGIFRMLDELAPVYAKTGYVRGRMGADTVNAVPHSHYRTRDGKWVALACTSDKMFERLAKVMERPDLAAPDRFGAVEARLEHRGEVNRIVAEWMASITYREAMDRCLAGGVPIGPINTIADIFEDVQFKARENLVAMPEQREESVVVPNVLPRLSETPGRLRSLGPDLGQHNKEIYLGMLGLSAEELAGLKAAGIV